LTELGAIQCNQHASSDVFFVHLLRPKKLSVAPSMGLTINEGPDACLREVSVIGPFTTFEDSDLAGYRLIC
jgi:hypothetical protein